MQKRLAKVLNTMAIKDQRMRKRAMRTGVWENKIDIENTKKLKKIVQQYGWPTISLVGKKASKNAWLIAQHAVHDIKFMKKVLNLLENAYEKHSADIDRSSIAYLRDRLLVIGGRHQIFGTQFYTNKKGVFGIRPIKDRKNVDVRRKLYGLPPLEVYIDLMKSHRPKVFKTK